MAEASVPDIEAQRLGSGLLRATSAPPNLEISAHSLFAFRADYAGIFSDIRCEELYDRFYKSYADQRKLPPPVEASAYAFEDQVHNRNSLRFKLSGGEGLGPTLEEGYADENAESVQDARQPISLTEELNPARSQGYVANSAPSPEDLYHAVKAANSIRNSVSHHQDSVPHSLSRSRTGEHVLVPTPASQVASVNMAYQNHRSLPTSHYLPSYDTFLADPYFYNNGSIPHEGNSVKGGRPMDPSSNYHPEPQQPRWQHEPQQRDVGYDDLIASQMLRSQPPPAPSQRYVLEDSAQSDYHLYSSGNNNNQQYAPSRLADDMVGMNLNGGTGGGSSSRHVLDSSDSAVCRFFQQGYCGRGDACQYLHTDPNPPKKSPVLRPSSAKMPPPPPFEPLSSANSRFPPSALQTSDLRKNPNAQPPLYSPSEDPGNPFNDNSRSVSPNFTAKFASFDQVIGKVVPLARDQHGCRYLQKKLEERNPQYLDSIFKEVIEQLVDLMTDPFGNYLLQKLVEFCTDDQRLRMIEVVSAELVNISLNMHGTRAVQRLIDFLTTPPQITLVVRSLRPGVVALSKDLNGNHVIQQCLRRLTAQQNQFVYDGIKGHCVSIATHRHGCCVLQRCIDCANQQQRLQLVSEIIVNAQTLVQDPFGNYVVQYVLDLGVPAFIREVCLKLRGCYTELAAQKFSSNVVEKCLQLADADIRAMIVQELANPERISRLLQDPYANYVVQRALSVVSGQPLAMLVDSIRPHLPSLRNTPYGKRIQSKILKKYPSLAIGGRDS
mmetsp:Transcript_41427/g.67226  ORF Transcript_41427/g.67226 Transcript_41427/m.67226 type:complete len:777 (+) Transcript_41427:101-2431(+)|eukprot:CAMPEP_0184657416 /NCGR_PEP_ID=MMETSP0308-20130426/19423_1 /TAXON_ID=38269 /ORGANISM="Gloeochaete witrockiana, Strain SAG 46.84" /LENGTH=776 /DNA_ID=CAMNT_0027095219 /DNA_START=46 /DNA_END=2376 /DNA_ORIENTATION=+